MPLLPYDYLHLVNCPEVVTISDIYMVGFLKVLTILHAGNSGGSLLSGALCHSRKVVAQGGEGQPIQPDICRYPRGLIPLPLRERDLGRAARLGVPVLCDRRTRHRLVRPMGGNSIEIF